MHKPDTITDTRTRPDETHSQSNETRNPNTTTRTNRTHERKQEQTTRKTETSKHNTSHTIRTHTGKHTNRQHKNNHYQGGGTLSPAKNGEQRAFPCAMRPAPALAGTHTPPRMGPEPDRHGGSPPIVA